MKGILSLIVIVLSFIPLNAFSQRLSANGFTLGDSFENVGNTVLDAGYNFRSVLRDNGNIRLVLYGPMVGGVSFDNCFLEFDHNKKLFQIIFYSNAADLHDTNPGGAWEAKFQRKASECKSAFHIMEQNLILKYGSPNTAYGSPNKSSNLGAIWQKGNERIFLKYEYMYEYNNYNHIDHSVEVQLIYETIDLDNLDY